MTRRTRRFLGDVAKVIAAVIVTLVVFTLPIILFLIVIPAATPDWVLP